MPPSSWPLWLLTGLLLVAFPALNFVYWPQVLQSSVLPSDGDSIGIPMFGSFLLTVIASPFLLGLSWLCLRKYNPATRIAAFRRDRPYRSAIATLVFGGVAALLLAECVLEAIVVQPWYEYLWPAYIAIWVLWLLALRAALIEQGDVAPEHVATSAF